VVNRYVNFAIESDPKFFHKLHIQSVSENLKLWTQLDIQNPKLPTHLHISENIWYGLFCLMRQMLWLFCL